MTLVKRGASAPSIPGSESLRAWQEWISPPGYRQPAPDTAWAGFSLSRGLPAMWAAGNATPLWNIRGNTAPFFRIVNDIHVLDVFAVAGAIGAQESAQTFLPLGTNGTGIVDFLVDHTPLLESARGVSITLAEYISCWMRKRVAGDATSCAQFVGFANDNGDLNRSTRVARIGIMGDGALGFRFGSVNCPNAPAGGADNGAADIDANSVQPSVLVNPGVNWFHVRVKMIPGIEGQPGRVGCYLNGRLRATFTQLANFPRTSRSGIDVSGGAYWPIVPCFAAFGNGGAAPSPGYYIRGLQVGYTEDTGL